MPLIPGIKLGQYEVVEAIGAGGMGEVYRARDTKLGRDVAIKVLPAEFARDRERLDRFEREARLLAQLNHAHIATLHGLEEHGGQQFIVMELVEGETLAERIAKGPIPLDEAIPLFIQIAEGLEAAHEKAIIHRDLKPPNIKIGPDGKPKILDFGLAKAFAPDDDVSAATSQSPTLTKGTALGAIMGTASYMSPEQARGQEVDKRTDIWAYGCCFYETLTAKKAFTGDSVTDILAAVVRGEPELGALARETTPEIRKLLRRCFSKGVRERLRDIGEARIALTESQEAPAGVHEEAEPARRSRVGIAAALFFVLATGALIGRYVIPSRSSDDVERGRVSRSSLRLPPDQRIPGNILSPLAISPEGERIAYVALRGGEHRLFIRELDSFDSTSSNWDLCWAPRSGGETELLLERAGAQVPYSWSPNGELLFGEARGSGADLLVMLPGGEISPVMATQANEATAEFSPDGRWIAYGSDETGRDEVYVRSYPEGTTFQRVSEQGGVAPRWSGDGDELFYRSGIRMMAVTIETEPELKLGIPRVLFEEPFELNPYVTLDEQPNYDVAPEGDRFLMVGDRSVGEIKLILNWDEELERLVPTEN